jgi:hypothetical protein
MDATALNTVLMAIVLPVIGGLWWTLLAVNKTLSSLTGAITGIEGQGGALVEIRGLRKRMHRMESVTTALLVHTGIDLPRRRSDDDEDEDDD